MANIRQYVGARYVTKIYENSLDSSSAEWESNVAYEPLTMVTYNNSSYLSKKDVPANIGNPAQNPTYWVVTGAYNGQIAALQSNIDAEVIARQNADNTLQSNINTLANKSAISLVNRSFILIGDSYGEGYDGTTGVVGYNGWTYANKALLEAAGATCHILASPSGNGFIGTSTWENALSVKAATMTEDERKNVTDIVILGGTNDISSNGVTYAQLQTAISDFFTYAKSTFPNAQFKVGIVSAVLSLIINDSADTWQAYSECTQYGAMFVTDGALLLNNNTYMSSDGTHLTSAGYQALSPYLFNLIVTGHTHYKLGYSVQLANYLNSQLFTISPTGYDLTIRLTVNYDENSVTFRILDSVNSGGCCVKLDSVPSNYNFTRVFASALPKVIPLLYDNESIETGFIETNTSGSYLLDGFCNLFVSSHSSGESTLSIVAGPSLLSRTAGDPMLFNLITPVTMWLRSIS